MEVKGNIGSNVEKKIAKSGKPYYRFRVAENFGKDDNKKTTWYDVNAFIDDLAGDMLGMRMYVHVKGRLDTSIYEKADGTQGVGLTILAFEVEPTEPPQKRAEEVAE
ncbi:single-stranded DNA-binding protein [Paraburkholderia sp. UCT31]|uniref:single-stranded DNA-binding protein n=1 Tax=Paraburkholderia sp. UCT31 TaxID=2615209 RepID=UPI0016559935|nr:single-stranded DNA-binding protein [Paraburkholderia sp. UCT31]MBC8738539.1 single-stranded DNA-binding protein [Paraburkholderia sp. UCT31]